MSTTTANRHLTTRARVHEYMHTHQDYKLTYRFYIFDTGIVGWSTCNSAIELWQVSLICIRNLNPKNFGTRRLKLNKTFMQTGAMMS
jgi:hypothetical protein